MTDLILTLLFAPSPTHQSHRSSQPLTVHDERKGQ